MNKTLYPYYKIRLTKWFLTVTLLFSIITFSGYAGNSQSRQVETTQTEVLVSNNPEICKRTISYKKGMELIRYISPLNNSNKNWSNSLMAYNLLTKEKLNTISREIYSHKPTNHFLQVKIIPQSTDEDLFATYIG